jgi:hypothetical protein
MLLFRFRVSNQQQDNSNITTLLLFAKHPNPSPYMRTKRSNLLYVKRLYTPLASSVLSERIVPNRRARRPQGTLLIHVAGTARTCRRAKRIDDSVSRGSVGIVNLTVHARRRPRRESGFEVQIIVVVKSVSSVVVPVAYIVGNWRCLTEST